jgi:hypothetical protein
MVSVIAFAFAFTKPCSAQAFHPKHAANATGSSRAINSEHHNHYRHSNAYGLSSVGYYPYAIPYGNGYGGLAAYYPYRNAYLNYGAVNLNSGLERGFQYGNTYINPNFGN